VVTRLTYEVFGRMGWPSSSNSARQPQPHRRGNPQPADQERRRHATAGACRACSIAKGRSSSARGRQRGPVDGSCAGGGADDFKAEPEGFENFDRPARFEAIHKQIDGKGIKCDVAHVTWLPTLTVPLEAPAFPPWPD